MVFNRGVARFVVYSCHHKTHHEFTNKLTSLVLYHGEYLDDFLMPLSTTLGGYIMVWVAGKFGFAGHVFSNFTLYLAIPNTLMSHAHDIRCARLIVPLPDSLNFVAYHYVHHLAPDKNFGLTKPSDVIWDKILGTRTIIEATGLKKIMDKFDSRVSGG